MTKRTEAGPVDTLESHQPCSHILQLSPPGGQTHQESDHLSFQSHCMFEREQKTPEVARADLFPTAASRAHMVAGHGTASSEPCQAKSKPEVQSVRKKGSAHIWDSGGANLLTRPQL